MKTGLVLEGGAMRGIYTAGVLDVFMENDILVDGVVGVSAGSIHGASYISKQHGRNIRYTKEYCNDWRFMSVRSMILTGSLVGEKFCYDEIPKILDRFDFKTFDESPIPFYAGVTNLETGKAEYIDAKQPGKELDIIRASSSMPVVSPIVEIDGKKYLDGGTADSIPVKAFMNMGYERNIVVLTRPEGYQKEPEKMLPLMNKIYKDYPLYLEACKKRYYYYNQTIKELKKLEEEGKALVIRPSRKVDIGRMEHHPEVIEEQYELGREDALALLSDIKSFCAGKGEKQ